jgi:hypothetical protein
MTEWFMFLVYIGGATAQFSDPKPTFWERVTWPMIFGVALFDWALHRQDKGG